MVMILYEAAIGLLLVLLLRWLWRLLARAGADRRLAGVMVAGVAAAFFWPWAWYADWATVGRAALAALVVGGVALGYARLVAAAGRAARRGREDRE